MRTSNNPNRHAKVNPNAHLIASAIVHMPDQKTYHEHRMEVIQTSLLTMRDRAGVDCATLIWDNGSCDEVKDWLRNVYKPDYLMLSPNVGKASARASIYHMFPGDTIIGIADDDMYYYQDWLKAHLEVLKTYPDVGQVSGYPVRTSMRWGNAYTIAWAKKYASLKMGHFIPEQWDRDFCTSIGRDYSWHDGYTREDKDYLIEYKGVKTYGTAQHCQFVAVAKRVRDYCLYDTDAMGDEKPFDMSVDNSGQLRLTTEQRYVRHIGNRLDEDMK